MNLFCFGIGNVSRNIAESLSFCQFSGTHFHEYKLKDGEYIFNENIEPPLSAYENATHILISVPPCIDGDPVFLKLGDKVKNLKNLKWLGYISSTSVYGDHQGNWVTEESKTIPSDVQGKNRLLAEKQWLSTDLPVVIIRMSAIYDKNNCVLNLLRDGKAIKINKPGHCFSRAYIKDITNVIIKMMQNDKLTGIYNLADDMPSSQAEVISFGCSLLNIDEPELVELDDPRVSENMRKYYFSNKKVDNTKLKNDFQFSFSYPSYKEGLEDIVKERAVL